MQVRQGKDKLLKFGETYYALWITNNVNKWMFEAMCSKKLYSLQDIAIVDSMIRGGVIMEVHYDQKAA